MFTILINESTKHKRKNKRNTALIDIVNENNQRIDFIFTEKSNDKYRKEQETVSVQEEVNLLNIYLDNVTTKQREALILLHYHEYTLEEIAEMLELPLSTVKGRVNNGHIYLRQMYQQNAA